MALISRLIALLDTRTWNFDAGRVKWRLGNYDALLQDGLTNWYAPEDAVSAIAAMMIRDNAEEEWDADVFGDLTRLITRHREMAPLLRPEQPDPSDDDGAKPAPLAHLPESLGNGEEVAAELGALQASDAFAQVTEPEVGALFRASSI